MKIAVVYNRESKNVVNLFGMPNKEKIGHKTIKRIADALRRGGHQVIALEGAFPIPMPMQEFREACLLQTERLFGYTRSELEGKKVESLMPDRYRNQHEKLRIKFLEYKKQNMEIGQKVKVYRIRDRVSSSVADKLGKVGTIKEYKMTDGSGVGVIIQFDDKSATWFFEDEVKPVS